ncbi:MAG: DUF2135 domain-containing protein [Planctomycetota bacterium]|jgi:uncharacterized protein YfaP (DUF2135 family)
MSGFEAKSAHAALLPRTVVAAGLLLGAFVLFSAASDAQEEPAAPPAAVKITAPAGGQTRERVVTIQGTVTGADADAERLTLVLNGVPLSIPVADGKFATSQVLAPGWNAVRVVLEEDGRTAEDEVAVYAMVPPKDLRITLTWDTPATDIDLWVTGPDGEKIYYQYKQGTAGGTLDTDVTTGYGPETYTQARAQPGVYRVQAHYYGGAPPTRATLTVIRGEGTPKEERRVFRALLLKAGDIAEAGEFVVDR